MNRYRVFGIALLVGSGLAGTACGDDQEMFLADLRGSNEVPPVTTNASGSAVFTIQDDGTVTWTVQVSDIVDATASHIHDGAAGVNGPVVVDLFGGTFSGSGTLASGTITGGTDVSGMSFEELKDRMRAGTVYVNVHTQANPGGEIRGQIIPQ